MDINLNEIEHSNYKYGEAPQVLGIAGALNKIMNTHPYKTIGNFERDIVMSKPSVMLAKTFKTAFVRDASFLMLVEVLLFSSIDNSSNPIVTSMELNIENNIFNTYSSDYWEENGMYFELHTMLIGQGICKGTPVTMEVNSRDSEVTSNILVYASSYLYDIALKDVDYIEPKRFASIVVENFLLPSTIIRLKQAVYYTPHDAVYDRHWISSNGDNQFMAWLPLGVNLSAGDTVHWEFRPPNTQMATDDNPGSGVASFITEINEFNVIHLQKYIFDSLGKINSVYYYIYDSSNSLVSEGYANYREFRFLWSKKFQESTLLFSEKNMLDEYTMNALIDTARTIPERFEVRRDYPYLMINSKNPNYKFENALDTMGFNNYKWLIINP